MTQSENEFMKKLFDTFKVEAGEHLSAISSGLLTLEAKGVEGVDNELINTIFREAHSLKGAARAVNHVAIQNICQSLENVFSMVRQKKIELAKGTFDTMYKTLDLIQQYLSYEGSWDELGDKNSFETLISSLDQLADPSRKTVVSDITTRPIVSKQEEKSKSTTIRVSTDKLDSLLQQIEEMLVIKITSKQRTREIQSIVKDLEAWNKERKHIQNIVHALRNSTCDNEYRRANVKESILISRLLAFVDWQDEYIKKLTEKLIGIKTFTTQDTRISSSVIDNLLDDTKRVLMQPFATAIEALPRMVRDISHTVGKEIELVTHGEEIEIDRRILEEIKDPIIHLVRNSIDHGIETPEARISLGKQKLGRIVISASQVSGNGVEIVLKDDGKGINIDKLKQAAVHQKYLSAKEAEKLNDTDALKLIYLSGVSTSDIITDLSGRGVGLGVVAEKVEKMGGNVTVNTQKGEGTTFTIALPLTLATYRGVHIQVCDEDFIMPTSHMIRALRVPKKAIETIEGQQTIQLHGNTLSYTYLGDILGLARSGEGSENTTVYIVVIKAAETVVALGVDRVLNEQEIFIKGLGSQLIKMDFISAATIMEWGKVVPVLDAFDIIKSITEGIRSETSTENGEESKKSEQKTILVTDDTVTARMLLKNILDSAGYAVVTAVDGLEAYSMMLEKKIDLLLSDIEMPRMNGFELTKKVRETDKIKETPIVLCTSLGSREDRERGISAGANAYIKKSSFAQSNLLETIEKLL